MLSFVRKGRQRCDRPADDPSFHPKRGVSRFIGPRSPFEALESPVNTQTPAPSSARHDRRGLNRYRFLATTVAALAIGLSACATGASPSVATLAAPTGSIEPAATATPSPSPSAAPAFPTTLTDDEGTAVKLAAEPMKIVSLTPSATETLFALGVGDRVVGKVEDVSLFPPEAGAVPDVAKFGTVDVEKIVS